MNDLGNDGIWPWNVHCACTLCILFRLWIMFSCYSWVIASTAFFICTVCLFNIRALYLVCVTWLPYFCVIFVYVEYISSYMLFRSFQNALYLITRLLASVWCSAPENFKDNLCMCKALLICMSRIFKRKETRACFFWCVFPFNKRSKIFISKEFASYCIISTNNS